MNPGERIEGKYEILFKLNEGGMGEVYKVRHLLLDEVFVIKKIRAQLMGDVNLRQRFHREARTAIRLKHPNIASIHDFFIGDEGTAHLVMEFIEGVTLKEILARFGSPSLGLTLEMARQTLGALDFLHGRGFLHRDISPDNLMLSRDFNGEPLVKLLDLGLARRVGGGDGLTATGMFLGKARYSPPEQLSGQGGDVDETSDLYAFGVTLYELLTGCPPIDGHDFPSLITGHLMRPPREFAETDPQDKVPEALRRIVLKTLEKKPAQRFASAEEVLTALGTLPPAPWSKEEVEGFDTVTLVAKTPDSVPPADETAATALLPGRKASSEDEDAANARTQAIERIESPIEARELALAQTVLLETEEEHGSDEELDTLRKQLESHQSPNRRPWLGAAALILLLAAALFFFVSRSSQPALTEEETQAREAYRVGVEAFDQKDWGRALSQLNRALDLDGTEKLDATWDDPTWRGRAYLPHFYFGAILAEQGNCVKAFEALETSKAQAVVQQTPQGETLEEHVKHCEEVTATTLEMLRTTLDTVRNLAAPLQAALGEESFWGGASELRAEVEGALADFSELEIRFEAALKRRDYGTLFSLEEALLDSRNQLDRLAGRLAAP